MKPGAVFFPPSISFRSKCFKNNSVHLRCRCLTCVLFGRTQQRGCLVFFVSDFFLCCCSSCLPYQEWHDKGFRVHWDGVKRRFTILNVSRQSFVLRGNCSSLATGTLTRYLFLAAAVSPCDAFEETPVHQVYIKKSFYPRLPCSSSATAVSFRLLSAPTCNTTHFSPSPSNALNVRGEK